MYDQTFAFDLAYNRTGFEDTPPGTPYSYVFGKDNQNTGAGFAYDGSGNPTQYNGSSNAYAYDPEQRLTGIGTGFTAHYDGDGMRTQFTVSNATTYYLYDDENGGVPVAELAYAGTTTSLQYLNGTCADGWRLRYVGGVAYVETYDPQGSIVQSAQDLAAGQSQYSRATYCYDGFGALRGRYSSSGSTSNVHQDPAGFGGQYGYYQDLQTGLEHLGARYYDGGTGRFVTRDPIGYGGGENLYAFCGNNPITESDPEGTSVAIALTTGLRILPNLAPVAERAALGTVLAPLAEPLTIVGGIEASRELYIYGTTGHIAGPFVGAGDWLGDKLGTYLYPTTSSSITVTFAKRGPKTGGAGPHNQTIARRIAEIKAQNPTWTHKAGGNLTEEYIPTPNGSKAARRPDITFELPNKTRYREQVGKRTATGSPVQREIDAMDDIQQQTGSRPHFTPYN